MIDVANQHVKVKFEVAIPNFLPYYEEALKKLREEIGVQTFSELGDESLARIRFLGKVVR